MAYVSQDMKKALSPAINAVLKKHGVKASISVRHHSSLVVTIRKGIIDFGNDYFDVNVCWIKDHYTGTTCEFFLELLAAMKGPDWFCNDDSQTDYFHRSHYTTIRVGQWNKPYICNREIDIVI
jgi:hypothetical protein